MKKTAIVFIITLVVLVQPAFGFSYELSLVEQIDEFTNTQLNNDGALELGVSQARIRELYVSPDYANHKLMYLSTEKGIYANRSFDDNFQKETALSNYFPGGVKKIQFEGTYADTGMILAYDESKMYISYNYGNSWSEETFDIDEEIIEADFGPKFSSNTQIYIITEYGLYRKSLSSGNIQKILVAETDGELEKFRYVPTQQTDRVFFIVKGDILLKTEDYGSTWLEKKFSSKIKDFEIKQKSTNEGDLMVLTEDNVIYYSGWSMNFFELDLPAEINTIYAVDYIILTDQGFYITYNNGDSWQKLEYDNLDPIAVSDYEYIMEGSQELLFIIFDNVLMRDVKLREEFSEYMDGIDLRFSYFSEGTAISKNLLELTEMQFGPDYAVTKATLSASGELNDQIMEFYMTADGMNWEEVVNNEQHIFEKPGLELKWKVEMSTDDTSSTPLLHSVSVDYGVEKMENCEGFTDIDYSDPHCPAIKYVKQQGIFSGYPDGTFGADVSINRAETLKVITEGFNYEILSSDGTDLGFSDVGVDEWYMQYLKTAKEAGIIEGYPDGTFRPSEKVIYVEMLKIFFETAEVELTELEEGRQWYQPYVDYANENDLVPYDDVASGMKRADVAELFYQWSQL